MTYNLMSGTLSLYTTTGTCVFLGAAESVMADTIKHVDCYE